MSKRGSFSESAAFGLVTFAALAVIGVGGAIVIARLYGIEAVGAYALAFAPVGVAGTLSTMQEQAALVRELATLPARAPRVTGLFAAVMAFSATLTTVVAAITAAISAVVLSGPMGRPELVLPAVVLLAEYVVVTNTIWNVDMIFAAFRTGRRLFYVRLLHGLAYLGLAIAFSGIADGVWGLVYAQIGSSAIALAARLFVVRSYMRLVVPWAVIRDGLRTFPEILRFGRKMAHGFVADGVAIEAATWVLGLTTSVVAVGAWSRAWQLVRRLFDVTWRVAEVLFPTLVERRASGDAAGFDRALVESSRLVGLGLLLPAAVAGGAADGVMDLFGPGFDRAAGAFAVLLVIPVLFGVSFLMSQALVAVERPLLTANISTVRALLVVVLGVPLSLAFGLVGMAVAMLAAFAVDVAWRTAATRPYLSVPTRLPWPGRALLAAVAAYAAGFAAARVVDAAAGGLVGLAAALAAGTAAFGAAFVLAGGIGEADRARLEGLRRRLRRTPAPAPAAAVASERAVPAVRPPGEELAVAERPPAR